MDPMEILEALESDTELPEEEVSAEIRETVIHRRIFGDEHCNLFYHLRQLRNEGAGQMTLRSKVTSRTALPAFQAGAIEDSSFAVTVMTRVVDGKKIRKVVYSASPRA
jgi:hypothetical protein